MTNDVADAALAGRLFRRLVLPIALLTVMNAIDRMNISYAAVAMMRDLHFGPKTFGVGVSAFFAGYLIFQYPHAALLRRVGVKAWLGASLLVWGLVGLAMAFISEAWQFHALRFLLGAAEAGFAPGVTFIIAQWVPASHRARAMGVVLSAIPIALVVGGPLCGWMLSLSNPTDMPAWRFMFILQAIPNLLLMIFSVFYFVDRPADASWLTEADRRALARSDTSSVAAPATGHRFFDRRVLACAACWFFVMTGGYALIFWVPQLVRQLVPAGDELAIGVMSALPQAGLLIGMLLNARHSDQTNERVAHFGFAALLGGAALLVASFVSGPIALLTLLTLAGFGVGAAQGVFWAMPAALGISAGRVPVAVIVALNMAGTLGGVVGPMLIGFMREATGSFTAGIASLAALLILAAPIAFSQRRRASINWRA